MIPSSKTIQICRSIQDIRSWRKSLKTQTTVGFVPTMGALHAGHAELLEKIRPHCDFSVLSIFVNPTQFGPKEDLSKYPRTWDSDLKIAEKVGVDVIFAPTSELMYPEGYSTYVEETKLSQPLCGLYRPGHFRGVTTVVFKLLQLVQPQLAYFGLKDAQQFFVLRKMAEDLHLDVSIRGVATVRERDGLAMSSRNIYLSSDERQKAIAISHTLRQIEARYLEKSSTSIQELLAAAQNQIEKRGISPQYFECLELPSLATVKVETSFQETRSYLVAFAGFLGTTRLIDNVILGKHALPSEWFA